MHHLIITRAQLQKLETSADADLLALAASLRAIAADKINHHTVRLEGDEELTPSLVGSVGLGPDQFTEIVEQAGLDIVLGAPPESGLQNRVQPDSDEFVPYIKGGWLRLSQGQHVVLRRIGSACLAGADAERGLYTLEFITPDGRTIPAP